MTNSLLSPILLFGKTSPTFLPRGDLDKMSNFTPNREDVDLVRYYGNQASELDRANMLLQAMARESNDFKAAQSAIERYGRSVGIVIAFQLLREAALPMGKAKR
jgi:hypothetical protein